jgi:hypothetical protein
MRLSARVRRSMSSIRDSGGLLPIESPSLQLPSLHAA